MRSVVVVGTGHTAPWIAAAAAIAADSVTIVGRNRAHAEAAAKTAAGISASGSSICSLDIERSAFVTADLVIETIVEDFDAKVALFRKIAPWVDSEAIVTTNTSSLSLDDLADAVGRASHFAGLHFLHPAHQTQVVEIVAGSATADHVLHVLNRFAKAIGKTPIRLNRPIPGYIWNRIQFAVLRECLHLLNEGVADAIDIDTAVADGLAPRWLATGPLASADLGGTETFQRVAEILFPQLSTHSAVRGSLAEGKPFYLWDDHSLSEADDLRATALNMVASIRDMRLGLLEHQTQGSNMEKGNDLT